jgi:hypothetical protein
VNKFEAHASNLHRVLSEEGAIVKIPELVALLVVVLLAGLGLVFFVL